MTPSRVLLTVGRRWALVVALLALALAACTTAAPSQSGSPALPPAPSEALLVAAAADLEFAFAEMGETFEAQTGQPVTFTFGSTGHLTTQIENGAPFDILAAANQSYIDQLAEQGRILTDTRQLYAQGRLALVVNREAGLRATTLEDLADAAIPRIAIANPDHAPYGQAAMQALQTAGVWDEVRPRLVLGENVAQALQFVQTGDAPVGIVALSVASVPEVSYTLIDPALHAPLNQALAVIQGTPREAAARAFIAFVNSAAGRAIMQKYGFLLPGEF